MKDAIITLEDFSFSYPGAQEPALREISLSITAGELLGVIGPSGAGKSSLGYALSGFIPLYFRGEVSGGQQLFGQEAARGSLAELSGRIGLVVQNPFNQISGARYTVRGEVAFGLENLGVQRPEMEERVNRVLEQLQIEELQDRSPFELSGGQQQRLALASILAMEPEVIILDEPTSQLDPAGSQEVFQAVHTLTEVSSTTVVLISHELEWLAEFADRVLAVKDGRIQLEGPPRQVLADPALEVWGIGTSQYTRAARLAADRGHTPPGDLPLTLKQAADYFS